jgi:hypothetical protein
MIPLLAAALLLAAPEPASAAPQARSRTVSCNLTIGHTLHQGDDCVLRRVSADREELRGGDLRLQIVYRSQGDGRRQVTLNGHAGSQSPLSNMEGVSGITADAFGPNSIAYQWWVAKDDEGSENDGQEQTGSGWSQ